MIKIFIALLFLTSCKTFLQYEKEDELAKNTEFDKQVVVKEVIEIIPDPQTQPTKPMVQLKIEPQVTKKQIAIVKPIKKGRIVKTEIPVIPQPRQPDLEDSEGFNHLRRPPIDPFRVGEKVVHSVRFFATEAGTLTLETKPLMQVNSKKSYHFQIGLQTSRLFSAVYSVEDSVDTFLDYDLLVPHVYKMSIRESGKLAQTQGFFNHDTLSANYWEKKYTQKNGQEDIKKSWSFLPFSQNAFSSIFYMRIFNWKIGKEYSFRVSDDEKNVIFKGTAISKEKLETEAGHFNAIKIKADIIARGALSTSHPLLLWVTDDDRKILLRMEADIKIGSLVSEVIEIEKGAP